MPPRKLGHNALFAALGVACSLLAAYAALPTPALATSGSIVISQVYGGGGNSGATYKQDFIELFNRGSVAVNVTGWTVQYGSSGGTTWQTTPLTGTIPAGGYYLIQEAQGTGGSVDLPTPDVIDNIPMSATAAKVALVNNATALTGACPGGASIVDLVGYGSANCSEGTAVGTLSNTNAALRKSSGCEETDVNSADFAIGAPTPRNSASATHSCQYTLDVTASPLAGGTVDKSPDLLTYQHGTSVDLTPMPAGGYSFTGWSGDASGAANPLTILMNSDKTITANFAVLTHTLTVNVTGSGSVTRNPDQPSYAHNTDVELTAVPVSGWHFVSWGGDASGTANPITVTMDADKTVSATFAANSSSGLVVVSQVYGGGGNAGATLKNDFIELFNRGSVAVDVSGWTVQYGSASGTTWQTTALSGSIPAGRYYLVQEAQGAGGSVDLPTPDATDNIAMGASAGKVALVNNTTPLSGACPSGGGIIDLVGYGTTNCSEGSPTAPTGNTTAALRKSGGCTDTDDNSADFLVGAPNPRNSASPLHSCDHALSVSANPLAGGSVGKLPDQLTYAHGSSVQLTATRVSGYHFVGWSGDASGIANPITVVMDDDKTIVANFVVNTVEPRIVISQVYGGGGNTGADYKNDFVELFNRGNAAENVTGWTVQYAAFDGGPWYSTTLIGTIVPGQHYLVQLNAGGGGTLDLPAADAIGTIAVDAVAGKVALVSDDVVLTGDCPTDPEIVDFVGYGGANCAEGTPAGALDNVTAAHRNSGGCDDTQNNLADFTPGSPTPRNTSWPLAFCPEWLGVGETAVADFALAPVSPNPSGGPFRIEFSLPRESNVRLRVHDIQGRVVASLADGTYPAGRHELKWTGASGGMVARSGIYFVSLEAAGKRFVRRFAVTN